MDRHGSSDLAAQQYFYFVESPTAPSTTLWSLQQLLLAVIYLYHIFAQSSFHLKCSKKIKTPQTHVIKIPKFLNLEYTRFSGLYKYTVTIYIYKS